MLVAMYGVDGNQRVNKKIGFQHDTNQLRI
jgi:hypothetical protein